MSHDLLLTFQLKQAQGGFDLRQLWALAGIQQRQGGLHNQLVTEH